MRNDRGHHRSHLWIPAALAWLAFLLRVLYLLQLRDTPLFDTPGLDSAYYLARARAIAGGDWLGDQVFFMGPLYPYLLAVAGKLTGFSLVGIRLLQALLGSLAVVLLFLIGRRFFDLRIASTAALALALNPAVIFYDNLLLMTGLVMLLNLIVLLELSTVGQRTRTAALLGGGALLGITALARASILLFAPAALAWIWVRTAPAAAGRRRFALRAVPWRPLASYAAGLVLVLGLVAARNVLVGGDRVLVTANGGLNFFIGNNPLGVGTYVPLDRVARAAGIPAAVDVSWMADDPSGRRVAEAALGRRLRPSEISAFYAARALEYIRTRPGRALRILGRKLLLFWNATEIAQIEDITLHRRLIPLLAWPLPGFGLVGPFALLGLVVGWRERRRLLLLDLFVAAYTLSIVLFFVTSRYRAPLVPVLLLFAAHGAWWLGAAAARAWRARGARRELRRVGLAVAGLALAGGLVHLDLVRNDRGAALIHLGIAYAGHARYGEAIDAFQQAVAAQPTDPAARYNLAAAYLKAGRYSDAQQGFESVLALNPRSVVALVGLGRATDLQGDLTAAGRALRGAAQQRPRRADIWAALGDVEERAGRADSARAAYERATAIDTGAYAAWKGLARLEVGAGRYAAALEATRHAAAGAPGDPRLHSQLGMLEAMQGHGKRAEAALRQALRLQPAHLPAQLGLVRLFLNGGRLDSARVHLERARRLAPGDPRVAALAAELARR